jgi:hypothetical protein
MLRDPSAAGSADGNLQLRFENTVNTPVVSVAWLGNGQAVAGEYTLVVDASGSPEVAITAADSKNPWVTTGVAITADGSTRNDGALPGVGIVFSASSSTGWTAKITIGAYMDGSAVVSDRLNIGIVEAGDTSTARRIAAVNVGDEDSAETKVYALPGFYLDGVDPDLFVAELALHPEPTRHAGAVSGDYAITFADYNAGASPKTVDVYVDGTKAIEDAKLDGSTAYYYGSGNGYVDAADKLAGLSITLANDPGDPTAKTFDLYVRDGYAWCELADDSGGSPGTWGAGPITLTESGEVSGVVTPAGTAYFHHRANLPAGASPGALRLFTLRVRGLTI